MDQFWLSVEFLVEMLNLLVSVTMFTVLAFATNLNSFSMLAFTSGTKDIFRLVLYLVPLFNGLLPKSLFEKNRSDVKHIAFQKTYSSLHST